MLEQLQPIMILGFALAAYSVIGNDVIQTLGTFLSSNGHRPWYVLFAFIGSILAGVLLIGWYTYDGDPSYGRLVGEAPNSFENPRYPLPATLSWIYLIPPIALLIITRLGIPVSTSFLILTFFSGSDAGTDASFLGDKNLEKMVIKSMAGYGVAFVSAVALYLFAIRKIEMTFAHKPLTEREMQIWTGLQWVSTSFLWVQWLIQDFANIYAYFPRRLDVTTMLLSMLLLLIMLAYIFYSKGGAIQKVVTTKFNTADVRSATIIDFSYASVLTIFTVWNTIPMSTTWVFVGLLAGRELSLRYSAEGKITMKVWKVVRKDLVKVLAGLALSVLLVKIVKGF